MIYLPFKDIDLSAAAISRCHQIPQVYLMEKVYLLGWAMRFSKDPVPQLNGNGEECVCFVTMKTALNTKQVFHRRLLVNYKLYRLAVMWKPYPVQLLSYAIMIEVERQKKGTKFPAKSLYHRLGEWLGYETQALNGTVVDPGIIARFPWREEVYAAHRAHMNSYGYNLRHAVPNKALLYPMPLTPTKLKPTPRFERELKRLVNLYR